MLDSEEVRGRRQGRHRQVRLPNSQNPGLAQHLRETVANHRRTNIIIRGMHRRTMLRNRMENPRTDKKADDRG